MPRNLRDLHWMLAYLCTICIMILLSGSTVNGTCSPGEPPRENEDFYDSASVQKTKLARLKWSRSVSRGAGGRVFRNDKERKDKEESKKKHMPYILGPMGPLCKPEHSLVLGGEQHVYNNKTGTDGQKSSCGLKSYKKCSIFSIGSYNEWSFEESVFDHTNCNVFAFDCMIEKGISVPPRLQSRVSGHNICLGHRDEIVDGKEFKTWESIVALTGITAPPVYLKMDIEGFEWEVLGDIVGSAAFNPKQIAFELHWGRSARVRYTQYQMAEFFLNLYEKGGYFVVDRVDNPICFFCLDLLLVSLCL